MNTYILATEKEWHFQLFTKLKKKFNQDKWYLVSSREELNRNNLKDLNTKYIFFPHWSYIIPKDVFQQFECIVFHMTDLPYGRGGSPLQNLILKGHKETKLSAIKVEEGIDTGPVYLKKDLSLSGAAWEIFERVSELIEEMIIEIINNDISPTPQFGEPVIFKRRKPNESKLPRAENISELYDFIRMLDAPGYPHAFIEHDDFKIEFTEVQLNKLNELVAHVRIFKK